MSFRVSDAVFEEAMARWGTTVSFRGLRVVPAFPTVADAGWLIVASPHVEAAGRARRGIASSPSAPITLAPDDLPSAITPRPGAAHRPRRTSLARPLALSGIKEIHSK